MESTCLKKSDPAYLSLSQTLGQDLGDSITLAQLANRPKVNPDLIRSLLPYGINSQINTKDIETVVADLLYSGYITAQRTTFDRLYQHDNLCISDDFDFKKISGLSNEMVDRLERARPKTFGQIRRIPGLTPAALSTLLIQLTIKRAA